MYSFVYRLPSSFTATKNSRFLSFTAKRCTDCDYSRIYVCNTCHLPMINITSITPFNLFKLPLQYMIDKTALRASYLQYQNILHPDKHSGLTKNDLKLITNSSSYVNEAYKLLLDDKKRGIELLSQLNQDIKLDDCNVIDIFEIHESIDSLKSSSEVQNFKNRMNERIDEIVSDINRYFIEKNYDQVRSKLSMLGYFSAISDRLDCHD